MSLLDTVRAGIKIADKVTKPLQASVTYVRVTARDAYGAPSTYAAATTLKGIVEMKSVPVRTRAGVDTLTTAVIDLLDVAEISAKTGGQGVDADDEFTLPNGSKGKVLNIGGFVDAGTGKPIPTRVMLG